MSARKLLSHYFAVASRAILESTDLQLSKMALFARAFARVFFHYGGGPSKLAGKICLDPGKSGIIVVATTGVALHRPKTTRVESWGPSIETHQNLGGRTTRTASQWAWLPSNHRIRADERALGGLARAIYL